MAVLQWDAYGERVYEAGVNHGVLFVETSALNYGPGEVWNGLTTITETPGGGTETKTYADNIAYISRTGAETYGGTINALSCPQAFDACDGLNSGATGMTMNLQRRAPFCLSYETGVGRDTDDSLNVYTLHIIYGCRATPTTKDHNTLNEDSEILSLSWTFTTLPSTEVPDGFKPTSAIALRSDVVPPAKMQLIKDSLYGTATTDSVLLSPLEIDTIINTP